MFRLTYRRVTASVVALTTLAGLALTGLGASSASAAGTPGVTATSVTIGATVPESGIAAPGYSEVAKAANAVFKWVNTHGKINGRTINFIIKDDCYGTPGFGCTGNPNTNQLTKDLINTPVFATVGSLGTPTQAPERSVLKGAGVPQLFVNSGSTDWNSPKTYPMLFGWQQSYQTESMILGQYIKANYAGKKVCFLGQGDDFGHNGYAGLTYEKVSIASSDVKYYSVVQLVINGASSIQPYINQFQTDQCKVVFLDTIPGATAAALGDALSKGFTPKWVISSVGSDPITVENVLKGLTPDPEIGAISFAELPASTDSNPWNAWMRKVLLADSADFPGFTNSTPIDGNMAYGIGCGVSFVEALRAAGKTFTRASFVATLQKTSFQTPGLTLLKYSSSNHQGLLGGYVTVISSATATSKAGGVDGGGKVYVTPGTKGSSVKATTKLSTSVPSWLQ